MSTALVVYDHKFPITRGQRPVVPAPFSGRSGILPAALPAAMDPEVTRCDGIVILEQGGTYGPDAKIIPTVSPGLILDIYA